MDLLEPRRGQRVTMLARLLLLAFLLSQADWLAFRPQVNLPAPPFFMVDATSGRLFKMQRVHSYVLGTSDVHDRASLATLNDENGQDVLFDFSHRHLLRNR